MCICFMLCVNACVCGGCAYDFVLIWVRSGVCVVVSVCNLLGEFVHLTGLFRGQRFDDHTMPL